MAESSGNLTLLKRLLRDDRLVAAVSVLLITGVLLGGILWTDTAISSWHERDLSRRADLVANALDQDLTEPDAHLQEQIELLARDERLLGVLVCLPEGRTYTNRELRPLLRCDSALVTASTRSPEFPLSAYLNGIPVQISAHFGGDSGNARIIVVQDRGYIWTRRRGLMWAALVGGVLALFVVGVLLREGGRLAKRRAGANMVDSLRSAARGERSDLNPEMMQILDEMNRDQSIARAGRESDGDSGPGRLRRLVNERMPDTPLVLVANREPYIHEWDGDQIRLNRPASGLVTGVEPLLKACGGVWIGHGSGSADRDMADSRGRLQVPPENPEYVLRRVTLTQREEEGYYYGFSNEGLWPLCHIAHARPTFRESDWEQYRRVNRKFAEAAADEAGEHGLVLVQDYHFALLPQELRALAPDTVISLFWHIPWPNQEVVGICPWKNELLAGMLGADIIGFHTRYHCLNFLDTVARYLEARVELETMSIEFQGHRTRVKPYPISVKWPYPPADRDEGARIRERLGLSPDTFVALGVDRADYTKGLLERLAAVEVLLEEHPELIGKFVFVQIAAPSRTHIKRYRDFVSEVEETALRVNRRFGTEGYDPVLLQLRHFTPTEVRNYYAMADVALVTPLHDGMNLVAKEYVASCSDERGALILSIFTGAAKELEAALLVNPYDAHDVARAIYHAMEMPEEEQRARMQAMRTAVEKNTIYDWSAALLSDLAEIWEKRNESWRTLTHRGAESSA